MNVSADGIPQHTHDTNVSPAPEDFADPIDWRTSGMGPPILLLLLSQRKVL